MAKTKKNVEVDPLLDYALDIFLLKIFDLKNTVNSFSDDKKIYTKDIYSEENNNEDNITYRIYNKKLVNGNVDNNSTTKTFTEYELYKRLFLNDSILCELPESIKLTDLKQLIIKTFQSFKVKETNIISLMILNTLEPSEIEPKKLKRKIYSNLKKEELSLLSKNALDKYKQKKSIDKIDLEEKILPIINLKEISKNNKWLNNTVSFPGIYFSEHYLQLIKKILFP